MEYTGTRRQERFCVRIEILEKNNVLLNRDFKWSTQELDVRRGSVYG